MSWDKTYSHNVLIGVDQLAAAVFFNRNDLTVSALCRIVQLSDSGDAKFQAALDSMKLARWQIGFLRKLAPVLDWIQAGHCELARLGDIGRARSTAALLLLTGQVA
jgi:hypothetical protein